MDPSTVTIGLAALTALGVLAAAGAWWRRRESAGLRDRLRRRVMGDERAVRRLIEYERERSPGLGEDALVRAALRRLERDNR